MKTALFASAALLAIAAAAPSFAQSTSQKAGVNQATAVAPQTQDFVNMAGQSGMLEIQSSKLALQKSDNAKTKTFAQKMIDDHTAIAKDLKGVISSDKAKVSPPPETLDKAHQAKLDKLTKLQGKDFTKQYDDMQVSAHKDAVSLFERYSKDGDNPALKSFAAKTLPKLQEHLKMAEALEQ